MKSQAKRLPFLLALGIFTLYGAVLAPLYQYLIFDIVLADTLWLDLVDLLYQYAEIAGGAVLFAFLIHAVYRDGAVGARPALALSGIALLYKYVITVIAVSVMAGSLDLTGGLADFVVAFIIEGTTVLFSFFLSLRLVEPLVAHHAACVLAARKLGEEEQKNPFFPFHSLFERKNPLQLTLFWCLLFTLAWRLLSAILSELAFSLGGAAFSASDLFVMLLYWLILILLPIFLSYFLGLLCINLSEKQHG